MAPRIAPSALLMLLVVLVAPPLSYQASSLTLQHVQATLDIEVSLSYREAARLGVPGFYASMIIDVTKRQVYITDLSPLLAVTTREEALRRIISDIMALVDSLGEGSGGVRTGSTSIVYIYATPEGGQQHVYRCRAPLYNATLRRAGYSATLTYAMEGGLVEASSGVIRYDDGTVVRFTYSLAYYQGAKPPCGSPMDSVARSVTGATVIVILAATVYAIVRRPRPALPVIVVRRPAW
jgi:hypothetical protein